MTVHRYLVPFHPKEVAHHFTDILVLGGGLAGLRAAMAASADQNVLVVTKDVMFQSNSNYAQGGIAGVLDPQDNFDNHIADTLTAGGTLCNSEVVESVICEAPNRINELINWGTEFDKEEGSLALGKEGGHSHHRVVHALGDATGREVMRVLIEKSRQTPNIRNWENTFTLDLLTQDNQCYGALVWHPVRGKMLIWAKQTILCTGGAGQVYRETTNPKIATADGHAIAYRAGVELRDLEFIQFHPTMLYIAGSSRTLITEAIRGEGAHLIDRNGYRFMKDYDPQEELAPRDVVSQAIVSQMEKTRYSNVFLDLNHLDGSYVRNRFPGIAEICEKFDLDITKDRIPVRPGAHYMIGGVTVNDLGQTSVNRLWAAGEVTSTGLHGANRLASNSLLEALVYGARSGIAASEAAKAIPDQYQPLPLENNIVPAMDEAALDLVDIRNSLRSMMWRNVGIRREHNGLQEAIENVNYWCRYVLQRQFEDPDGWQLQNMLAVSKLIIEAAIEREESRGVHLRSDFPNTDDEHWKRHLVFQFDAS